MFHIRTSASIYIYKQRARLGEGLGRHRTDMRSLLVLVSCGVVWSSAVEPHCNTSDFEQLRSVESHCCRAEFDNTEHTHTCLCPEGYQKTSNRADTVTRCTQKMEIGDLFVAIGKLAVQATWHAMRYVLPFLIYPIVVFFGKLALHFGTEVESGKQHTALKNCDYYRNQFEQARVLTWTFKAIVLIFVSFSILQEVGIETGNMLEITTVFSLGLSWSMRDWLASVWGCFMLAFCTALTPNKQISIGLANATKLKVRAAGLVFVECELQDDKHTIVYVPNSALVAQGFKINVPPDE